MEVILLSHFLNEKTPGYGGSKDNFQRTQTSCIECGNSSNSELWSLKNHHGTHIDCPKHFIKNGKTITEYAPEKWIFRKPFLLKVSCRHNQILDLKDTRTIIPDDCDFLIIKTDFQKFRDEPIYSLQNPGISPELGEWIKIHKPMIKAIGFDFISLTSYQNRELGREAHRIFLGMKNEHEGIRIVEDMKLDQLDQCPSMIVVSPLFVEHADGGPVTVWAFLSNSNE